MTPLKFLYLKRNGRIKVIFKYVYLEYIQISRCSDYCISLKNSLVPTIQPEPDFSLKCVFQEVLYNVKLVRYMKCQKILMIGCRDMGKNTKNTAKIGIFSHLWPQRFFSGPITFLPLWCTMFMQKIRKNLMDGLSDMQRQTNWWTDQQTDGQGWLQRTPLDKLG